MNHKLDEQINILQALIESKEFQKDALIKLKCLEIFKETIDIPLPDLQSFGQRLIDLSEETKTSLYDNTKYMCDTVSEDINVYYTLCLFVKHQKEDENLLNIVRELNALHEKGKINFDKAANFISEQFDVPIGRIMNLLILCL